MMPLCLQFSTDSEQYLVAWDRKGMPKDIDRLNNLTVLFTVSILLELWSFRPGVNLSEGVSPCLQKQTAFFRSRRVKQGPEKASALTGYVSLGLKSTLPMTGVS